MYAGSWTWTPNSTWVNDVRTGVAYIADKTTVEDGNKIASNPWPAGYGMNTGVTNPAYGGLPSITINSFTGYLGAGADGATECGPEGNIDFVDNV